MARRQCQRNGSRGTSGSTSDLMPSVMGAFDALWDKSSQGLGNDLDEGNGSLIASAKITSSVNRRQINNFARLSRNVQKILANVPDEELSKNFSGDETLLKKFNDARRSTRYQSFQQRVSPEKNTHRSNESLDIISPNVQKILSNLPDTELVLPSLDNSSSNNTLKNNSFLHRTDGLKVSKSTSNIVGSDSGNNKSNGSFLFHASAHSVGGSSFDGRCGGCDDDVPACTVSERDEEQDEVESEGCAELDAPRPLGSYLHKSPSGIASRTPAGRKNLGKFLQVPSESSVGTNSTASSEVSRPVSLTSLGSCSSSSSGGGPTQPGSAYLASAESLDSDLEPSGSQGSADSGIAEQPTMSPELCVLQEVMDTEKVYVDDLGQVIEGYLKPWKNDSSCPLVEHLQDLFSNIEEIYRFNREFLEQLKEANFDPTKTANCFIQNDSGFSIYTEYCTHYPRTMDVLGELTRDEKIAALFREKQMKLGHALPLGSYLLKPVQRILKYHLLLQRLSKQCSTSHKPAVDLALATMTSVATHINTMKRKHEHAVRVQEIQSQLYGWTGSDLTALGELIAEGTFRVGGARGRRHAFLFDKVLLLAKTKPDGYLAYKMHIMCSNLMLVEQVRGEPLSFHVLPFDNPRQQCTLRARSALQKREWTLQLKRAILENYNAAIPSHARQLVMQLGQDVPDVVDDEKWSPPLKQHSAPQYLERRSRFRKTRDSMGSRRAASTERSFPTLPNWRRKSEPGIINQYTTKTLPKRITKLKKVKDQTAKFYTDFSDSENVGESMESLNVSNDKTEEDKDHITPLGDNSNEDNLQEVSVLEDIDETEVATNTLERVVSDLLMQNQEFQRVLSKQKKGKDPESPDVWPPEETELPNKADSLPRDFQLNQQEKDDAFKKDGQKLTGCLSFKMKSETNTDERQEKTILLGLDEDNNHPEHKIYRKSVIRSSLVQRFRAMLHEEQKQKYKSKVLSYKQGSESMGAKIAHPDYVEPVRLFSSTKTLNSLDSPTSPSEEKPKGLTKQRYSDQPKTDTDVNALNDLKSSLEGSRSSDNLKITSQNFDSFYESLMEQRLSEEYIMQNRNVQNEDKAGTMVKINYETTVTTTKGVEKSQGEVCSENPPPLKEKRSNMKRPTKAPPPIPSKPSRLLNNSTTTVGSNSPSSKENVSVVRSRSEPVSLKSEIHCKPMTTSKGWVKTVVGRFE
ncbi:uncharacterized protein LOC108742103 [Agrilus planipennis]|uniref:Uncharacterized protein LOC108742103 n=1 Tax=Agrilus planipennis TaxID=224129 RepID=A0A1W4X9D0_AGRPL|nr:uncharacterized protein LOC108742103 [Agrilus planipennis]